MIELVTAFMQWATKLSSSAISVPISPGLRVGDLIGFSFLAGVLVWIVKILLHLAGAGKAAGEEGGKEE